MELLLSRCEPTSARLFRALLDFMHEQGRATAILMAKTGTHHRQAMCLVFLSQHPDIKQAELAQLLRIEPATLSSMLQRMERAGFVARRRDEADQRAVLVALTDEGRAEIDRIGDLFSLLASESLSVFSPSEREALTETLTRLVAAQRETVPRVLAALEKLK